MNSTKEAIIPGSAEGCGGGGGSWLGQIRTGSGVTRAVLTPNAGVYDLECLADAWYDHCSDFSRFCWLMFASLQHHALYLLQHQ